jgi:hypothetical protein
VAPASRPASGADSLRLEHVEEGGAAGVGGVSRRAAVAAEQSDEFVGAVGGGEDAAGDDLFAACALACLLGELDELVDPGVDRDGQAEPDRPLRAGGKRRLGWDRRAQLSDQGGRRRAA